MAFLVKLRPMGPWRAGSETGERGRVEAILHSDSLYSALTHAMSHLGRLGPWLDATARAAASAIRFSSCFPFAGPLLYVTPPRTVWPPPPSSKVRWRSARFVPTSMVSLLLNGRNIREDDWLVDGASECLLPVTRGGAVLSSPFRPTVRSCAAVDRLGGGVAPHRTACIEFNKDAGIWAAFDFRDDSIAASWTPLLQGALRLLADTGLGGGRSRGWGRFEPPEFVEGPLPRLLFGRFAPAVPEGSNAYWLLSLFSPAEADRVQWQQGNYSVAQRSGRVESPVAMGALKKSSMMVEEGSVLVAGSPLSGMAHDVAPEGFAHPVYRAGFALALPLPGAKKVEAVVEESTEEPASEPELPESEAVAALKSEGASEAGEEIQEEAPATDAILV